MCSLYTTKTDSSRAVKTRKLLIVQFGEKSIFPYICLLDIVAIYDLTTHARLPFCPRFLLMFSRLHYPVPLLQSTIRDFVTAKVSGDVRSKQTCDDKKAPSRIILPFKDQRSANSVRRQLGELSCKIGKDIHPVYTTRKIGPNIRPKESKPPIVNQQCVVYHFKCDLCDADYVGYTCRHLYQRIEEHKGSAIGKHV